MSNLAAKPSGAPQGASPRDLYHPVVGSYVEETADAGKVSHANWLRASAMFERLKPGAPALAGSLNAFVGKDHAAGLIKVAERYIKACEAYLGRISGSGKLHPVLERYLNENRHEYCLLSEYGWFEVTQLIKGAASSQLAEQIERRLPARIAGAIAKLAASVDSGGAPQRAVNA